MNNRLKIVLAALALLLIAVAALTPTRDCLDEQGIGNGVGDPFHLSGKYIVAIDGTFDMATATMRKAHRETGGGTNIIKLKDVSIPALVGVVAETPYVELEAGEGYYLLEVSGGGAGVSLGINVCKVGG